MDGKKAFIISSLKELGSFSKDYAFFPFFIQPKTAKL